MINKASSMRVNEVEDTLIDLIVIRIAELSLLTVIRCRRELGMKFKIVYIIAIRIEKTKPMLGSGTSYDWTNTNTVRRQS